MMRFMCCLVASFILPAAFAAVLHFIPVLGPLFAPFKLQTATGAGFWREAIFNLCCAGHVAKGIRHWPPVRYRSQGKALFSSGGALGADLFLGHRNRL